jgi:hypothetical protein
MAFNNGPKLVTQGLNLLVDAGDPTSYPGTGTTWRDVVGGQNGIITGSVSYTSEFYGGLTFSNSSSAVIFPGSTANYGTGSFTVEMAFKPTFINGRHYLMSKNSGSFPNWAIYLSGSAGTGKLWSEFRTTAAISCSVSSSTTFVTGSVYQVDVVLAPGVSGSGITVDGLTEGGVLGNGGGSLTNTGSLFVGNFSQNNTQNFSGSIFTLKTYSTTGFTLPAINFNATATRLAKQPILQEGLKIFELLVVAGGGGGNTGTYGGGGGAGGLQYIPNFIPTLGPSQVIVGAGGSTTSNGQNSTFSFTTSVGGGRGGNDQNNGNSGGSGGGGGRLRVNGLGTVGQGNDGGDGTAYGGGGGGAGSVGQPGLSPSIGGAGGSGSFIPAFSAIGGSPAGWFAGGGGGGANGAGQNGGIGGGGNGGAGSITPITGSVNTGGGAGGIGFNTGGAAGGSGIVAIRYNGLPIALGGEITQSAGFTYHVFRTVGTSSFTIF